MSEMPVVGVIRVRPGENAPIRATVVPGAASATVSLLLAYKALPYPETGMVWRQPHIWNAGEMATFPTPEAAALVAAGAANPVQVGV